MIQSDVKHETAEAAFAADGQIKVFNVDLELLFSGLEATLPWTAYVDQIEG